MFPFIPLENLWFSGDFRGSKMGHIGQKWINLMPSDGPTQKRSMNKSKLVIISPKKGRLVVSLLTTVLVTRKSKNQLDFDQSR